MSAYGTREDCTRDNKRTILPNSSLLGYSTNVAKRGCCLVYDHREQRVWARVVGRVHCEGKTYIEVIKTDPAFTMAYVDWIDPATVQACYAAPHRQVINFLIGEWKDPDLILRTAANGFAGYDRG